MDVSRNLTDWPWCQRDMAYSAQRVSTVFMVAIVHMWNCKVWNTIYKMTVRRICRVSRCKLLALVTGSHLEAKRSDGYTKYQDMQLWLDVADIQRLYIYIWLSKINMLCVHFLLSAIPIAHWREYHLMFTTQLPQAFSGFQLVGHEPRPMMQLQICRLALSWFPMQFLYRIYLFRLCLVTLMVSWELVQYLIWEVSVYSKSLVIETVS